MTEPDRFQRVPVRLIRTLFVVALAMGASLAHADNSAVVQRLTGLLDKAQTLTARLSQLTLNGSGTCPQETAGQLSLKRSGLFRWHTDAPDEQLLISNGERVWLYDPDLRQVTIQKLDQRLTQAPALLLSGDIPKISESFTITYEKDGDVVNFVLKPGAKDTLFNTLRLSFHSGKVNDMQMIDGVSRRTNTLFFDMKMNEALGAKQFTFDVSSGVDVIQE